LVIWGPYWSFDQSNEDVNIQTFLYYYNVIEDLADNFNDEIDFLIKPNTMLRDNFSVDGFWGLERTTQYFDSGTIVLIPN
jgi:hypothetical protein